MSREVSDDPASQSDAAGNGQDRSGHPGVAPKQLGECAFIGGEGLAIGPSSEGLGKDARQRRGATKRQRQTFSGDRIDISRRIAEQSKAIGGSRSRRTRQRSGPPRTRFEL